MRRAAIAAVFLIACKSTPPATPAPAAAPEEEKYGPKEMQVDASQLAKTVETPWVKKFLEATAQLPKIAPRKLWRDQAKVRYYTAAQREQLSPDARDKLVEETFDETFYYTTGYGSGLSYTRALEIVGRAGLEEISGKRVLDFGYGEIAHLRLLSAIGADATGIDVDPLLEALYSEPGDRGATLKLVHGLYPADAEVAKRVGGDFTLVVSKNVLKRGYIHPEQLVDPRKLIHLGVSDAEFLRAIHDALAPRGWFLIYNITPPPNTPDRPYVPWADGRSPFSEKQIEAAGFEVLAFDRSDDEKMREMGRALDWPDVDREFFALYTLCRKK